MNYAGCKVEMIRSDRGIYVFEDKVNNTLREFNEKGFVVHDIQYHTTDNYQYSAMVIYSK